MELETQLEDMRKRIEEMEVDFSRTGTMQSRDDSFSDLEPEGRSMEFGSPGKDRGLDSPLGSSVSEASSLGSKLTESLKAQSLKALSPSSPPARRRILKTAAKSSCLDQEVSVSGEGWLSFKVDRENGSLKVGGREGEVRATEVLRRRGASGHAEKDAGAKRSGAPGPATMQLYKKKLLDARGKEGGTANALEEFRESLKALEELENKEAPVKEYTNRRVETVEDRTSAQRAEPGKLEDFNTIKNFVSSGWNLLNAESKRNEASSSRMTRDDNRDSIKLNQEPDGVTAAVLSSRKEQKVVQRLEKGEKGSTELSDSTQDRCRVLSRFTKSAKPREHFLVGENNKAGRTLLKEEQGSLFDKQQSELVARMVEKRAEELVAERVTPLLAGAEQVLSDMKRELARVREENQNLQKARGSMQKEQQASKRECEVMQVELLNLRDDLEVFRKENDMKVEKCCQNVSKLLTEEADIKTQMEDLRSLHCEERESRKKAREEEDQFASKALVEALAKEQQHIAGRVLVAEREKAVIMDRIEHLSHLYLGALDKVRAEVTKLKRNAEASSSLGGNSPLADMRFRREKCHQLEVAMKDAIEEAVKLRDKYSLELEKAKEKWSWTMHLQAGEVNVILGNLKASFIELTGRLEGAESALNARIQRVEESMSQLITTLKPSASDDGVILENMEKQQGLMEKEIRRLNEKMQGIVEKLEQAQHYFDEDKILSLRQDVGSLGQKVREATKSRTLIMDKMSEMGRKIRKLEEAQLDLAHSVEEVRTCSKDLKTSLTSLYPKYEATANLVRGMDARLVTAEDLLKDITKTDRGDKQLGKPLSGGSTCELDVQLLHTRVETLEGRVEHVASATFTNLRILNSKVEHYRAGVQSAVEGAAMAESKCGVLGAEIVKVFRTLAARNEARDPNAKPARRSCRYCRKLSRDAALDGEEGNNHETSQAQEVEPQPEAAVPPVRRNKTKATEKLTFIDSYAESFYESGRDFKKSMTRVTGQQRLVSSKASKRKDNNNNSANKNKADIRTIHVQAS